MLSIFGLFASIFILVAPGASILSFFKRLPKCVSFIDRIIAVLIISGVWNYLFFLVRLTPSYRLNIYFIFTFLLILFAIYFFWKERLSFYINNNHLKKVCFKMAPVIIVVLLGISLIGYPLHKLNVSRSSLNPVGGDVLFFLYKTHLLRGGYSLFDDVYADNIASYPNFNFAQVALTTLITGGGLALNAETYRVVIAILVFVLFYCIGRALLLKESESILLSIISAAGYSIWMHLEYYVPAGMSFYASLLYIYVLCRAIITEEKLFWLMSGLVASLVIHSHMVHAIIGGIITFLALIFVILRVLLKKRPISEIMSSLKLFIISGSIGAGLFLLPLFVKYGFKSTSTFYLEENFIKSISEWFQETVFLTTSLTINGIALLTLLSFSFIKKSRSALKPLIPLSLLFIGITVIIHIVNIVAIVTRRLALYVDARDFYTISFALGVTFLMIVISRTIVLLLQTISKSTIVARIFDFMLPALFVILIFPGNPIYDMKLLSGYAPISYLTVLPKSQDQHSLEGNLDKEWDFFADEVHKYIPLYSSKVLISPLMMASLSGNFERQLVLYDHPYTNLFLQPPYTIRFKEFMPMFIMPNENRLRFLIKKYGITHIIWGWQDSRVSYDEFHKYPFLKRIIAPNFIGILFEVQKDKLSKT